MKLADYLRRRQHWVDAALQRWVPGENEFPPPVHRAMRYSLFAGGKRLRPILVLAAAEAVGGLSREALPLACSFELIHTYSLIHDDLPSMDNDDMRRGKPTSHKVFGEALAILAGDALLTEAFHLATRPEVMKRVPARRRLQAMWHLARAAGSLGMVGGQTMDILTQGQTVDAGTLEYIHSHKTGALISACVAVGAIVGGATVRQLRRLQGYGEKLGLAFQITDDLLDVQSSEAATGKRVGKDAQRGKLTFPGLLGLDQSTQHARQLISEASEALKLFGEEADGLRVVAHFVLERNR